MPIIEKKNALNFKKKLLLFFCREQILNVLSLYILNDLHTAFNNIHLHNFFIYSRFPQSSSQVILTQIILTWYDLSFTNELAVLRGVLFTSVLGSWVICCHHLLEGELQVLMFGDLIIRLLYCY